MDGQIAVQFLKGFFAARGLGGVSGCPLWRYRCSDLEFEDLEALLREASQAFDARTAPAACFCLYAAEWWHRHAGDGVWSWDGVFVSLGWQQPDPPGPLYKVVTVGLHYWGRQLHRGADGDRRLFLITLAIEGGLPLNLIRREGSTLRRYFRALIEQWNRYHVSDLSPAQHARLVEGYLPQSFRRQEIFELTGQLVAKIWQLQARVEDAPNPVEALNARYPGWLDELPISISEPVASDLVAGLVREAQAVAQGRGAQFAIVTELHKQGDTWRLTRRLQAPAEMPAEELAARLELQPKDLTQGRLVLSLEDAQRTRRPVAIAVRYQSSSDQVSYFIDPLQRARTEVIGEPARHQVLLIAGFDSAEVTRATLSGGEPLGELPWVFAAEGTADSQTELPRKLCLLGTGSVSTRLPVAFVAVESSWRPDLDEDGQAESIGLLHEQGRVLFRVRRDARFIGSDCICRIRTGSNNEEAHLYALSGDRAPFSAGGGNEVFLGLPKVRRAQPGGGWATIRADELMWRPRLTRKAWAPVDERCLGDAVLRHTVDGEVRMQFAISVLPKTTRLQSCPNPSRAGTHSGSLVLSGLPAERIGHDSIAGVHSELLPVGRGDTWTLLVRTDHEPPSRVLVHIAWSEDRAGSILAPYPYEGARFVRTNGESLPKEHHVSVGRLAGVRAEITTMKSGRWNIVGRLRLPHPKPQLDTLKQWQILFSIEVPSDGIPHPIDLIAASAPVHGLLAMTEQIDAAVELTIEELGARFGVPHRLIVTRFDGLLRRDRTLDSSAQFEVIDAEDRPVTGAALNRVELLARSFAKPEIVMRLQQTEGRFILERAGLAPGSYLILGYDGSLCRFRPAVHKEDAPFERLQDGDPEIPSLARIVAVPDHASRQEQFGQLFRMLERDPNHPDWEHILAYLRLAREVPPYVFDILNVMVRFPGAVALAALHQEREQFHGFCDTLELLPFSMTTLPVRDWMTAAQARVAAVRRVPIEVVPQSMRVQLELVSLASVCELLPARLQGARVIAELVQERVLGHKVPNSILQLARSVQGQQVLSMQFGEDRQALLRRHIDDQWPSDRDLVSAYERLATRTAATGLLRLVQEPPQPHQRSVLVAPALAALASTLGEQLSSMELFHLRQSQRFDPEWFESAHATLLASTVVAVERSEPRLLFPLEGAQ